MRWDASGNVTSLGSIPTGFDWSWALGTDKHGNTIVGSFGTGAMDVGDLAFVWDNVNGLQVLQDVLVSRYGLDLTGWTLREATDISADGTTIVGRGVDPTGHAAGWVVVLPEPATLSLLAIGGLAMLRGRSGQVLRRRKSA